MHYVHIWFQPFVSGSVVVFGWKIVHQWLTQFSPWCSLWIWTGDKTYQMKSAWTATGRTSGPSGSLLLVQRDSAVAEGGDPAVHAGLVCRENTQNNFTLKSVRCWSFHPKTLILCLRLAHTNRPCHSKLISSCQKVNNHLLKQLLDTNC